VPVGLDGVAEGTTGRRYAVQASLQDALLLGEPILHRIIRSMRCACS
jgi:hypothetical protein